VDKSTGLRSDQTVFLVSFESASVYPDPLRKINYYDAETGKRLKFLTNNFTLPALTIAQIYKQRWQVELFSLRCDIPSFWFRGGVRPRVPFVEDTLDGFLQLTAAYRLGDVSVHSCVEAALLVPLHGVSSHGNNGNSMTAMHFALANRYRRR
jgi:hypothetical protein